MILFSFHVEFRYQAIPSMGPFQLVTVAAIDQSDMGRDLRSALCPLPIVLLAAPPSITLAQDDE